MDGAPGSFADEARRRRFEIGHRETLPLDRITRAFKLAGQPFAAYHVARPTRPFVAEADIAQQVGLDRLTRGGSGPHAGRGERQQRARTQKCPPAAINHWLAFRWFEVTHNAVL